MPWVCKDASLRQQWSCVHCSIVVAMLWLGCAEILARAVHMKRFYWPVSLSSTAVLCDNSGAKSAYETRSVR